MTEVTFIRSRNIPRIRAYIVLIPFEEGMLHKHTDCKQLAKSQTNNRVNSSRAIDAC
jgi:hypothetical protein